jgi:primary-amine oxidase
LIILLIYLLYRLLLLKDIVQKYIAEETTIKAFKFVSSYLINPPKIAVLTVLGLPIPENAKKMNINDAQEFLNRRRAECQIIDVIEGRAYEIIIDTYPGKVIKVNKLDIELQPALHPDELGKADEALRSNPQIVKLAREVGIEPENLFADGWSIGYDDRFPKGKRIQQALIYARKDKDENLYAHPMDFSVVLDIETNELLSIDFWRSRNSEESLMDGAPPLKPTPDYQEALEACGRERMAPPMRSFDYLPELMAKDPSMSKPRKDLKSLFVVQPEGVSYTLIGNQISWQKWKFHIGFHPRDGLVISTVTYNDGGEIRPLFYRMSIAEMVVPYADTAFPHPRKFAFDVGEYGMGTQANSLKIGCDCLGTISYLSGTYVGLDGNPIELEDVICIHEEDYGLAYKHTDYRQGGKVHSARNRRLVVQMICTIANYDYIILFHFYTDGNIEVSMRLTGILNLSLKQEGKQEINPYGIEVAPQVTAQLHQHIFSLRIDPMIDGQENSIVQTQIEPTPAPTGSKFNYLGNGFRMKSDILSKAGGYDWNPRVQKTFSIINSNKIHYASGLPVSYRIHTKDYETLAARTDSMVARRARFAEHDIWVTKHEETQLWPAGKYVTQRNETPKDSISEWSKEDFSPINNSDIVVWVTFGITHIPRPEDFPLMPVEHLSVWLKPANFFNWNPAHDLPKVNDTYSKRIH